MIDKLSEKLPSSLRLSLSNLIDEFGQTDSPIFGLVVNLGLAAPGIAVALLASNPIFQLLGAAWAIFNIYPILSWVFGL
jgi:hypothetical protein